MNVDTISGRILLDTNILIYATLQNDTRHAKAVEVINLRKKPNCEVFISAQNLSEMYPNLTGPKTNPPDSPDTAKKKIHSVAHLNELTILPVTIETIQRAIELSARYSITRQKYFDMQLIAIMLLNGIPTILTENTKDFENIDGICAVNPFLTTC